MFTIIIITIIIICTIIAYFYLKYEEEKRYGKEEEVRGKIVFRIFGSILIGGLFSLIPILLVHCATDVIYPVEKKEDGFYYQTRIYSLSTQSRSKGVFVLGCGGFNEKTYYYYYKKEGNGFRLDKINAEKVIIYEDDMPPCIAQKAYKEIHKWGESKTIDPQIEIHVPKGTIIQEYNLK